MKWKNIDIGLGYYYITGTITQWLLLLSRPDIRQMVYEDIAAAARVCGASITAFVSEFVSGTSSRNTELLLWQTISVLRLLQRGALLGRHVLLYGPLLCQDAVVAPGPIMPNQSPAQEEKVTCLPSLRSS